MNGEMRHTILEIEQKRNSVRIGKLEN